MSWQKSTNETGFAKSTLPAVCWSEREKNRATRKMVYVQNIWIHTSFYINKCSVLVMNRKTEEKYIKYGVGVEWKALVILKACMITELCVYVTSWLHCCHCCCWFRWNSIAKSSFSIFGCCSFSRTRKLSCTTTTTTAECVHLWARRMDMHAYQRTILLETNWDFFVLPVQSKCSCFLLFMLTA